MILDLVTVNNKYNFSKKYRNAGLCDAHKKNIKVDVLYINYLQN